MTLLTTHITMDLRKTSRKYTDEGYLIVPARLARTGIQTYYAGELGVIDRKPTDKINVYRDEKDVFDPKSMASFENKPLTIEHPEDFVTADNWQEQAVGFVRNVRRDGNYLAADVIVTSKKAIKLIEDGKVELSNGYSADYVWEDGTYADQEYHAKQQNIRGNHIAIVSVARCGPSCRVADSQSDEDCSCNTNSNSKCKCKGESKMSDNKVKLTIDGIPLSFSDVEAAAVTKLVTDRDELKKQLDAANAKLANPAKVKVKLRNADGEAVEVEKTAEELATDVAKLDAANAELQKNEVKPEQLDSLIADHTALIADAKRLAPKVEVKGKTADAIRREVITACSTDHKAVIDAVLAGRAIDKLEGGDLKTVFNVIVASKPATAASKDSVALAIASSDADKTEVVDARAQYLESQSNAWQGVTK